MNWSDQSDLLSFQLKFVESKELNQIKFEINEDKDAEVLIFFGLSKEIFKFEEVRLKKIVFEQSLEKIKFLSEKLSTESFDSFYFIQRLEDVEKIASLVSFKKKSYYYLEEEISNYRLFLLLIENSKLNFLFLIKNYRITLNNFFENMTINTQNFENLNGLEKKSAILIGAGPSLEESIDEIKKFHKDVYIISCIRSAALLFNNGIKPDFFAVIDPNEFLMLPDDSFKEVPCFFSSTANYKQVQLFKYRILKAFNSHYPIIKYLQDKIQIKNFQDSGHTVLSFMYRVCQELNFCNVTLYGVDLCYKEKRKYNKDNEEKYKVNLIKTKDSLNNIVWTQKDFLLSKYWFENEILNNSGCRIFNNSNGLKIKGAFKKKKFKSDKKEKLILIDLKNKKELLEKIKLDLISVNFPTTNSYLDQLLFFSDLKDLGIYLYIEEWFYFFVNYGFKLPEDKFNFFIDFFSDLKKSN